MSVAPSILVRFQNVTQASQNAKSGAAQMDQTLSQLRSDLANMKQIWEGPAASDYKALQQQWDQAWTDLKEILTEISSALQQASTQYAQVEDGNRKLFTA